MRNRFQLIAGFTWALLLGLALAIGPGSGLASAHATRVTDRPTPPVAAQFQAPLCAGTTDFPDPR